MTRGQEFSFLASSGCETLRFAIRGTDLSKNPMSGGPTGPGLHTYKVVLTEGEWNDVVAELDTTLTWVVTGRSAGEVTRLVTTNDLENEAGITIDLSTADATLLGDENNHVSWHHVGAGDVNGDGNDDLFIAGYGDDEAAENAGAAYVVLGPVSGTVEMSRAHAKLLGEESSDYVGESISSGDVNDDGHDDLLLGVRFNDEAGTSGGAAYVVLGPVSGTSDLALADAKLLGERNSDEAGWSVAGAGDVNGDGNGDVLVGTGLMITTSGYHGSAYLVNGPVSGTLDLQFADARLDAEPAAGDGIRATGVGDMNGDGLADLLIGSPYDNEAGLAAGCAYLVSGPASGIVDLGTTADAKLLAEGESDIAGYQLSWAGDADGDGNDDVLIAAFGNDEGGTNAGAAYLVLSPVTGTHDLSTADAKLIGTQEMEYVGGWVAGPGDVDADGNDDLIIGASGHSVAGRAVGAAHLITSPVSGTIELANNADMTFLGERRDDMATGVVAGAGDVDADGLPDLLLGGSHQNDHGEWVGAAYLFYGGRL
jgi:hypothetical protein